MALKDGYTPEGRETFSVTSALSRAPYILPQLLKPLLRFTKVRLYSPNTIQPVHFFPGFGDAPQSRSHSTPLGQRQVTAS